MKYLINGPLGQASMRAKAIEIRWHNTKPIYSSDFQRTPPSNLDVLIPKKAHPYAKSEHDKLVEQYENENGFGKVWRLATAGGDNMVMVNNTTTGALFFDFDSV